MTTLAQIPERIFRAGKRYCEGGSPEILHCTTSRCAFAHEQWPYEPKFNGWRMHYVDEGAGDAVVLLHGNPAWGFLYRNFIKPLAAANRRVIVPDMIGFGLSEKPIREQAHSLDGHIANLTSLMRQLGVRNATIVCHDWGGPTGLGFALSNRDRVRALVIMSTWAWPLPPAEFHKRIFPWCMMHAPLVGPHLLGRQNALAGREMYLSVVDRKKFKAKAQNVYESILPDPASRLLTWTWPRWIPLDESARALARFEWLELELGKSKFLTLLVWGGKTRSSTTGCSRLASKSSCRMPKGPS